MSTVELMQTPITIPVAGVSFRQEVVRTLEEGQRLVLRRDPENEHDPQAISVHTMDGRMVGFVPKKIGSRFWDQPYERWGGHIDQLLRGDTWGIRLKVTHLNVPDVPVSERPYVPPTPVEAPEGAVEERDIDPDAEVKVYARSGRLLGVLQPGSDGSAVVSVMSQAGSVQRYPKAMVRLAS